MRENALSDLPQVMRPPFLSTRYQGSKRKLLPWIYEILKDIQFETVLDVFGGTGSVSYLFKRMGKQVYYNDYLKFNYYIGVALIENGLHTLSESDLGFLLRKNTVPINHLVGRNYSGKYYHDDENNWLDNYVHNIASLKGIYTGDELYYKQALAYFALVQSCLIKRPFNLFHRVNLKIRDANVERTFGNKKTWDTPFDELIRRFSLEANSLVFPNDRHNRAFNQDAFKGDFGKHDLVYLDPPYLSTKGTRAADYSKLYHFTEGLVNYEEWENKIDRANPLYEYRDGHSPALTRNDIKDSFDQLFEQFKESIIVLSYKSPGLPTENDIIGLLSKYNKTDIKIERVPYKYALKRKQSDKNYELIIVAR
jgi:adenine-specific DNA methylase